MTSLGNLVLICLFAKLNQCQNECSGLRDEVQELQLVRDDLQQYVRKLEQKNDDFERATSAYCGCSELVVGIVNMGKLPDLDTFDRGQIVGARRMGHSVSEIVRQLGFSRSRVSRVYQEYMDGGQKTSDRTNCKGQLALTVRGERLLRHIMYCQRSKISAQITTQLNDGASRTVSKRTNTLASPYGFQEPSTCGSTTALCWPSGCTSCLGNRAQRLEFRGLETSCME
ncbi:uncharacterized protein TNCV_3431021 [Trichonephila clavipes]|nr:uncharacterized protein TNCV_3431021 [Trichonephila clavipes]